LCARKASIKVDNCEIWDVYDFSDFGITGEAYLSVSEDFNYFSDARRAWDCVNNIKDCIPGRAEQVSVEITDELIQLIENCEINNFHILLHLDR
jgi:hypothetical protein